MEVMPIFTRAAQATRRLFKPPFSLPQAGLFATAMGGLSPFLVVPISAVTGLSIGKWALLLLVLAALYFLHLRTDPALFCKNETSLVVSLAALLFFVCGVIGSLWCGHNHICMDGHMGHPPYPSWHYLIDVAWAASLATSAAWLVKVRSPLATLITGLAAFLLSYRFAFESWGGLFPFPL